MPGPMSEEQLYYPNERNDNSAAGSIAANTDRTVDQFNRFSEENAANVRNQYANMASGIDKGMAGYRQGQESGARQRQYQQQYEQGEQTKQLTQQQIEEGNYNLQDVKRHHDYMNGTEEGATDTRANTMEGAAYKHNTEYMPKQDELSLQQGKLGLRQGEAGIAASNSATALNQYDLGQRKIDVATGNAAAEMQAALARGDTASVEQIRGTYTKQGLDAGHLARAQQAATLAIAQGQSARDLVWNTGDEGRMANAKVHDMENQLEGLKTVQTQAQQFHAARMGTPEEDTAYQNILANLQSMGPEGVHAAQAIDSGRDSAGGLTVDTAGFHTRGDRIEAALGQLQQQLEAKHQTIMAQYHGVPSPGFQGRLDRASQIIGQSGQDLSARQPGSVNILSGTAGGTGAAAQQKAWLNGNTNERPSAPMGSQNFTPAMPQQQQQQPPAVPPPQPQPNAQQLYNTSYQPTPQPPPAPLNWHPMANEAPGGAPRRGGEHKGAQHAQSSPFRGRQ